jgi:hypothetical protein
MAPAGVRPQRRPAAPRSFGPHGVAVVAISVILTPMFNAARGSLLIVALFHCQMNGPAWPDAQPWDALVFGIAAVVIAPLNRRAMLTRARAVTDVYLPRGGAGPGAARRAADSAEVMARRG